MPDSKQGSLRARPLEILALLPLGIALGILFGVLTNAINGGVSPTYFHFVFPDWPYGNNWNIWLMSIGQGTLEGAVFGLVSSFILAVTIALISKLRCPLQLGFRVQLQVVAFSLLFWAVVGFNGVLLAYLSPDVFGGFVRYHLGATSEILRIGWVGGSIWGVYTGSLLSTISALISFTKKWRQIEKQSQT